MKKAALARALIPIFMSLIASSTLTIQPIKADSSTITVTHSSQLVNAIYSAADGDTIFVKKGTYEIRKDQTLVIGKSISLIGEDPNNTKINLHPPWVVKYLTLGGPEYGYDNPIKIQASNVKLSGFTIASDGGNILSMGIKIQITGNNIKTHLYVKGRHQNISQNTLTQGIGCYGSYNTIAGNSIIGDGIFAGVIGHSNLIYGNTVTDGYGIGLAGDGNRVFNNTVKNCTYGVGVLGSTASNNTLDANILINNTVGLRLASEGSNNTFHANYVANNSYGVEARHYFPIGENNTFYHNNFVGNSVQVNTDPHIVSGRVAHQGGNFDNGKEGNYWSDYTGTDADGDGIGDTPYVIRGKAMQDHYPLMYPWGAPAVCVFHPKNATYAESVPLKFTVSKPASWMGYSLDRQANVTITGNTTLTGLSNGLHNITVYAIDMYGTSGASETIHFSIEPFPTWIVAAIAIIAVVGAALLFYFAKVKKTTGKAE